LSQRDPRQLAFAQQIAHPSARSLAHQNGDWTFTLVIVEPAQAAVSGWGCHSSAAPSWSACWSSEIVPPQSQEKACAWVIVSSRKRSASAIDVDALRPCA
jgi:hypothetical protein